MVDKIILITRPSHDETTVYCKRWSQEIIKIAKQNNIDVLDIKDEKVVRKNIESFLDKKKPRFVVFNGHGGYDKICGHGEKEVIIKAGENEHLLKSKIVYSISCGSAKILGKKAVEAGTRAYIGYKEDFIFYWDKNKATRPLQDEVAKPVFDSTNEIPISIIKGRTTEEAIIRSKQAYDYWIRYYLRHGELLEAPQNLAVLLWNKMNLKLIGNPEAVF